ncbi:MAG: TetR/AcrR family transcriptional regulator [Hyphomicrobium sp.]
MPRLKPDTQRARREHILDAAERCFARSGFHRCTMQDICKEAAVSPGALYVYFKSKEELIAGIAERDRTKLASQFAELAKAPDLLAALGALGEHYTIDEPQYKRVLCIEIGCESTRNAVVGEIYRSVDDFCRESFEQLFERARAEGKIAPTLDLATVANIISVIGDGLFWRRAVDPEFDAKSMIPVITGLVSTLLNPVAEAGSRQAVSPFKEAAR